MEIIQKKIICFLNQGLDKFKIIWADRRLTKILWIGFISLGLILFLYDRFKPETATETKSENIEALDTLIPLHHTLIPLEIKNLAQISSLMGNHTIADLYSAPVGKKPTLIARRIRLVKAPNDPQTVAALVHESEAASILAYPGPFIASLKPPQEQSYEIVREKSRSIIEIGERTTKTENP